MDPWCQHFDDKSYMAWQLLAVGEGGHFALSFQGGGLFALSFQGGGGGFCRGNIVSFYDKFITPFYSKMLLVFTPSTCRCVKNVNVKCRMTVYNNFYILVFVK